MPRARSFGLLVLVCLSTSAIARAQTAFTTKTVNLRAGPSRDFEMVALLPPGTAVQVAGCLDDWTWCDVVVGPDRGWMYAGNLDYPYQGRRVIVYGNGPVIGFPIVTFSVGPYWDLYYRGRPWYRRRSYWIGRPPPPHWVRPPVGRPVVRPPGRPPSPRPPAARPPAPARPRPVKPQPRSNPKPQKPPG